MGAQIIVFAWIMAWLVGGAVATAGVTRNNTILIRVGAGLMLSAAIPAFWVIAGRVAEATHQ